jgi:hypothetical protein
VNGKLPSDRSFGLVFASLFGVIALAGWLAFDRVFLWPLGIAGVLAALALVAPTLLMPLNRLWAGLGHRIAFAVNQILLGAFFYLVVTPFGLGARILRRNSMPKGPDPNAESYWSEVGRRASADSYPDMF